ncbi:alanyl-tRNA synthetase [Neisseria gonorrhoeae]|uniref:Alanyl-tRNA synthetase n=1 Tax=Neisseria gonorrhoeae TaxID=485 RepID=A0A378VWU0_NEIGO|nr:alanyl-tRNA synthetase [Neisseria gonorrhoeae]
MDDEIRNANMRNHSATHLMHKALRDVLGGHVEQKGSLVTAESTRFDISHPQAVTAEEIAEVERRVNEAVLANVAVNAAIMSMEDAQKTDAMMLFGENTATKYAYCKWAVSLPNCAAAHTFHAPATSASSKSSAKAVLPQACAVSKPSPA